MKKLYYILILSALNSFSQNFNFQRSWGTYFGDHRFLLQDSKVDKNGDLYIVGAVNSQNLPTPVFSTPNPFNSAYNGGDGDGFIVKFNNLGQLVWATYFGGNENDSINGIDIDSNNNIYIVGLTQSASNISTLNSFQPNYGGNQDFFIAKFSQNGSLNWSSYYGGSDGEISYPGNGGSSTLKRLQICHNNVDSFYISGYSLSNDLGTIGTFQPDRQQSQFIIAKFKNNGSRIWCTYYGINGNFINALSANSTSLYVRGSTFECAPPLNIFNSYYGTIGSFQQNPNSCISTFLSKFNTNGGREWSTYYPSNKAYTNNVKVSNDKIYIAGTSASTTAVTTSGAFQETSTTNISTSHLVQFNENGTRNWGTYCGLNSPNVLMPYGSFNCNISLDEQNNVYLTGTTGLDSNIATTGAYQLNNSATDGYVAKFNNQGQKIWGTYYGGNKQETAMNCHPNNDNFYIVGNTASTTGMTTTNCYQENLQNLDPDDTDPVNIFIAHFEPKPLKTTTFEDKNLKISPNPNNGDFNINLDNSFNENFGLEVYNILGERLHSQIINQNQNEIKTNNLSKGLYFVKISKNEAVWNGKVLVE